MDHSLSRTTSAIFCTEAKSTENQLKERDPDTILEWFYKYKSICDEYGILPRDRYNFDESGFRIGVGRDQWIVTRTIKRHHTLSLGSSTNRDSITVCKTISGDGYALPVMIIVPGTIHQEAWFTSTFIDDDTLLAVSETGYSNDVLSLEWLKHLDRFSAKRQHEPIPPHRLLLLDGYGSHCTKEFIEFCDDHKIIPLCLPPHTTHLLQPPNVVVFQPYKHYHAEAIDEATRTGCTDFSKLEFLSAITAIRKKTFKYTTILSAFRQTGLIPFNPEIVLDKLNAGSESELEPPYTPRAVTPGPSEPPTIPLTIRSLKRKQINSKQLL